MAMMAAMMMVCAVAMVRHKIAAKRNVACSTNKFITDDGFVCQTYEPQSATMQDAGCMKDKLIFIQMNEWQADLYWSVIISCACPVRGPLTKLAAGLNLELHSYLKHYIEGDSGQRFYG